MITFIIPTRNNLPYLKLAYASIRKYYPAEEVIILDDNSTDGTKEWINSIGEKDRRYAGTTWFVPHDGRQIGHTVLYDRGVEMADNPIFTIFHADMVCGPNYVENLLKHLKPGGVIAATRIEPPLHPRGNEKIIKDFGIYAEDFQRIAFEKFCREEQSKPENKDALSRGIFAPWAMYKTDFLAIGGHDKFFCPFPYEDSDIFQRMILKGYNVEQSRDAFVYHFTCRGHRWTKQVQKDDLFYKLCCAKNMAHFIRKWGSWIENDENCYPIIQKKYDIGMRVLNCNRQMIGNFEPWCSTLYCDGHSEYIAQVQPGTPFDMTKRVKPLSAEATNDIVVTFDMTQLTQQSFRFLTQLPKILSDSGEVGMMEYDIFKIEIRQLKSYEKGLVSNTDPYYTSQLLPPNPSDLYCTDALFQAFENIKDKEEAYLS